ncbi:MAG: hypothetical protein JWM39_877 [Parcubacteria group bacterium]|jgi:hypothetical protein|nr:hypothetical protein [Parcubacteria group bacterium]
MEHLTPLLEFVKKQWFLRLTIIFLIALTAGLIYELALQALFALGWVTQIGSILLVIKILQILMATMLGVIAAIAMLRRNEYLCAMVPLVIAFPVITLAWIV